MQALAILADVIVQIQNASTSLYPGRIPENVYQIVYFSRVASYSGLYEDGGREWVHNPLGIFCFCAATTHLGSMMTHVYPDSFALVSSHFLFELCRPGWPLDLPACMLRNRKSKYLKKFSYLSVL